MLMKSIGIDWILLMLTLITSVLINLNILKHPLPVKLICCLGINIGVYQHLRLRLILQVN
jgi:hypothetical protein